MSLRSNDRQWGAVAKFFHWVIALAIIGNGLFALLIDLARSPMQKINWIALHKSIGLTVLALVLLRVLWRWLDKHPRPEIASRGQAWAARIVHGTLYGLMLALPLTGWWFNSVVGKPLQWFKLFNLPALTDRNDHLRSWAHGVHEYLYWFLLLVLVAHVGAALRHHLKENDNVLRRMLPFARLRNGSTSSGERP